MTKEKVQKSHKKVHKEYNDVFAGIAPLDCKSPLQTDCKVSDIKPPKVM